MFPGGVLMELNNDQRIMILSSCMAGLCANPNMKYHQKYDEITKNYFEGFNANSIADLAIIHADALIAKITEKWNGRKIISNV